MEHLRTDAAPQFLVIDQNVRHQREYLSHGQKAGRPDSLHRLVDQEKSPESVLRSSASLEAGEDPEGAALPEQRVGKSLGPDLAGVTDNVLHRIALLYRLDKLRVPDQNRYLDILERLPADSAKNGDSGYDDHAI